MALRCSPVFKALPGLALLLSLACSGQPISVTVQAGGTVAVPLAIEATEQGAVILASYGLAHERIDGTRFEDPQRGELVLVIEDGDGDPGNDVEFTTRGVFVVEAPVESSARHFKAGFGRRLVLVADVPSNAPNGTWPLTLLHRRVVDGVTVETQPLVDAVTGAPVDYFGEVKILPPSIPIQLPDGTTETAVGTPTPDRLYFAEGSSYPFGHAGLTPELAMPPAAFSLVVSYDANAAPSGSYPGYLKLGVAYPAGVIDVKGVVLTEQNQGYAWLEDDGEGLLTVHGVGFRRTDLQPMGVGPIEVFFTLDDPETAILDPDSLSVEVLAVADELGEPVDPVAWGVVAQDPKVH